MTENGIKRLVESLLGGKNQRREYGGIERRLLKNPTSLFSVESFL